MHIKGDLTSVAKYVTLKIERLQRLQIFRQMFTCWERGSLTRRSLIYLHNPWRRNNPCILNPLTRYLSRFQFSENAENAQDNMCSNSSCSEFHVSASLYASYDAPLTRFSNSALAVPLFFSLFPSFHTARLLSNEGQQPSVAPGCARGIEPFGVRECIFAQFEKSHRCDKTVLDLLE